MAAKSAPPSRGGSKNGYSLFTDETKFLEAIAGPGILQSVKDCIESDSETNEMVITNSTETEAAEQPRIVYPSKWTQAQIFEHGGNNQVPLADLKLESAHEVNENDSSSSDEDVTEETDETVNLIGLNGKEQGSIFSFGSGGNGPSGNAATSYWVFKSILERKGDTDDSDEWAFSRGGAGDEAHSQVHRAEATKRALFRLCEMRAKPSLYIAVILMQAGRFVGTIFDRNEPVRHKVFKRYTTRRKQGGSQSAHDNKGSHAQSAGANIRRANEAALANEIKVLLLSWKEDLIRCTHVFLQASMDSRRVIFSEAVQSSGTLHRRDPRIKSIPMNTKKPSFLEAIRIHASLTSVHLSTKEEKQDQVVKPAVKAEVSNAPPQPAVTPVIPKVDVADAFKDIESNGVDVIGQRSLEWTLFQEITAKDLNEKQLEKVLIDLLDLGANLNMVPDIHLKEKSDLKCPLHIAAERDLPTIVTLFLHRGASPCRIDCKGRTPFKLAASRKVRDNFRRYRAGHEDQWNWDDAGVPEALTVEMEEAKRQREKEKKKRQREQQKERKRLQKEKEMEDRNREKEAQIRIENIKKAEEERRRNARVALGTGRGNSGFQGGDVFQSSRVESSLEDRQLQMALGQSNLSLEDQQLQMAMALSLQDTQPASVINVPSIGNGSASSNSSSSKKKSKGKTKAQKKKDARPFIPCAYCLKGEQDPFEKNGLKYCSTKCINEHRRALQAEAAEKRMATS